MGIKRGMWKEKKGFIFALITIFLVALFVFLLVIRNSQVTLEKESIFAERTEAIMVNEYMKMLQDNYLPMMTENAAETAVQAMLFYVNETKTPLADSYGFYIDLIMNGTIAGCYTATTTSNDFSMELYARNYSSVILLVGQDSRATSAYFGNAAMLAQEVAKPIESEILQTLENITLTITNRSADSGDIYLIVYNESSSAAGGTVVALDHFAFDTEQGSTQQVTFALHGRMPLDEEHHYYLVLAAPFTAGTGDYGVAVESDTAYSCDSFDCNLQQWTEDASGTTLPMPIDFAIDKAVMKESFLRSMGGYMEHFAQDSLGITTEINASNITVVEQTPWDVGANVTFTVTAQERTVVFSAVSSAIVEQFSIEGMYDPYSLIYEYGEFVIVPQNVTTSFDEEGMQYHLAYHTYVFNENAPSYLGRFAGKDAEASSCCGMQSILLADHIPSSYADADKGYSYVDYKFDNSQECSTDATNLHYLYYVSGVSWDEIQGQQPLLDYDDVEFYHLDEMSDATYSLADCPE